MGVWILEGDVGHMTRAVLLNSETERPLSMEAFPDWEEAYLFLRYADLTHADVLTMTPAALEELRGEWDALPKDARKTR
jgi:hypothetical protein